MRAWIEMSSPNSKKRIPCVALFMRAWIEIQLDAGVLLKNFGRPLHEGVD